jgi:hypothetical protein
MLAPLPAPPYVCKVCGAPKRDTNHWQMAITKPGFEGIIFQPIETVEEPRNPEFIYEELCGQGCSLKRHSRYLDDLNELFNAQKNEDDHDCK